MNNIHWLGLRVKTTSNFPKSYISNHSSSKNISHSNTYIQSYIQLSNIFMTILYSLLLINLAKIIEIKILTFVNQYSVAKLQ